MVVRIYFYVFSKQTQLPQKNKNKDKISLWKLELKEKTGSMINHKNQKKK